MKNIGPFQVESFNVAVTSFNNEFDEEVRYLKRNIIKVVFSDDLN